MYVCACVCCVVLAGLWSYGVSQTNIYRLSHAGTLMDVTVKESELFSFF